MDDEGAGPMPTMIDEAIVQEAFDRDDVAVLEEGDAGPYVYRRDQLLVVEDDVTDGLRKLLGDRGLAQDDKESGVPGLAIFKGTGVDIPRMVSEVRAHDEGRPQEAISRVAPNHVLFGMIHRVWGPFGFPELTSDHFFDLPETQGLAGDGVTIAVIDTGIVQHEWFGGYVKVLPSERDELTPDPSGMLGLEVGHGTFIAGIVRRYAPGATLDCRRALSSNGHVDDLTLARAVWDCRHADVISLSVGGPTHDHTGLPGLDAVLRACREVNPDLVVVAAAGNAGTDVPWFPAASKDVIGVAAVDANGARCSFSNYGWWIDACARGDAVLSTFPRPDTRSPGARLRDGTLLSDFDGWARWSGTSFAAPTVAAAIAAATLGGGTPRAAAADLLSGPGAIWRTGIGTRIDPAPFA